MRIAGGSLGWRTTYAYIILGLMGGGMDWYPTYGSLPLWSVDTLPGVSQECSYTLHVGDWEDVGVPRQRVCPPYDHPNSDVQRRRHYRGLRTQIHALVS